METIGILSLVKDTFVSLYEFRRFTAIFRTTDTIDAEIQQAQDASGTGAKAIAGLSLDETGTGTYAISGHAGMLDSAQIPGSEFNHIAIIVNSGTVVVLGLFGEEPLRKPPIGRVLMTGEAP